MKKLNKFLTLALLCTISSTHVAAQTLFTLNAPAPRREVRAMWLTTLKGLDWPKKTANTPAETERQKQELQTILDQLQKAGINTILFQSRIRSTTAYPSTIEPWDGVFTGTPGKAPLYDPLQFALDECHRRGMECHAWVVAFPICATDVATKLGKRALPRMKPQLCQRCGNQWMMDPGVPGTAEHIASICEEIVKKYDVDGIHLDYIRYPEHGIPFNDSRTYRKYGKKQDKNTWRRNNITHTAQLIHDAVKAVRPWVKISCSPIGKHADLAQQSSYGWNARDAVHQDAQTWLKDGLMDILFPMMYFDGKHFYPFAVNWMENSYGRQIVPGLGTYLLDKQQKDWDLNAIRRQMFFTREIGAAGQAHFRALFFNNNVKGVYDFAANDFYRPHASTPPMVWEDSIAPSLAVPHINVNKYTLTLKWEPAKDNTDSVPVSYNVYYCPDDTFNIQTAQALAYGIKDCQYSFVPALPARRRGYYAVTAVDAFGNESKGQAISAFHSAVSSIAKASAQGYIQVPQIGGAEFFLITDLYDRHIMTTPCKEQIYVGNLAPGCYKIRTLGKKGRSHHVLRFWKD